MKARTLVPFILLVAMLATAACGGPATPTTQPAATGTPAEAAAAAEPTPATASEAAPEASVAFDEAPCPMALPAGAVEGEHIVCGYVTVPEIHAEPQGPTIRLAVAVIPGSSGDPAPDPLFMLAGGPGQSALTSFVQILATPGMEAFWAGRDIVLVEQRGTRYSTPFLQCKEMSALKLELLGQDLGDEEEEARKLEAWATCHDRLVAEGANLSAYNGVENAADIVAVADALDYGQINLYGGSYGSLLAQHILRDYPERVRSAILDAVSPLRHEPNMLYKAHHTDRALRLLFDQCQAEPGCQEAYPDLEGVYFDLVAQLNEDPATISLQDPASGETHEAILTGDRLVAQTRDLLYVSQLLPDLPASIYDMAGGDYSLLALIQSQFLFQLNLADGMYNSVVCSELADFTAADMADAQDLYPEVVTVVEDLVDEVMLQPCQVWAVDPLDRGLLDSVAGDTPTLLFSGEFDPTVPPSMAEVAAEKMSTAYAYTLPAFGHAALGRSECAAAMMLAFLDDPSQAPSSACVDEMPGLVFRVPSAQGAVALVPYASDDLGIEGVAPDGWTEMDAGVLARGSSAVDQTVLIYDVAPITADEFMSVILQQFGLAEAPASSGQLDANGFAWAIYATEIQGYPIDFALTEDGEHGLVILMISEADEHGLLHEELFLPAVEALAWAE
jgi:pimeloyl-ACP methyl ester carboxylesterase